MNMAEKRLIMYFNIEGCPWLLQPTGVKLKQSSKLFSLLGSFQRKRAVILVGEENHFWCLLGMTPMNYNMNLPGVSNGKMLA